MFNNVYYVLRVTFPTKACVFSISFKFSATPYPAICLSVSVKKSIVISTPFFLLVTNLPYML